MPSASENGPEIRILPGIGPLVDDYDGLILDLWGVIHDGRDPYPGVGDTLARALSMPLDERRDRWATMYERLKRDDLAHWREFYLNALEAAPCAAAAA